MYICAGLLFPYDIVYAAKSFCEVIYINIVIYLIGQQRW